MRVHGVCLFRAARGKRGEDFSQPLGLEQSLRQVGRDQRVQLVHADRPTLTDGRSLSATGRTGTINLCILLNARFGSYFLSQKKAGFSAGLFLSCTAQGYGQYLGTTGPPKR